MSGLLVVGAHGQVGSELTRLGVPGLGREECDLTDERQVHAVISARRPAVVINAAAYTKVDLAESEADLAFAVNRDGAAVLAAACADVDAALIQLSTDYVFDGRLRRPYREDDATAPMGAYARSKWAGEQAVRGSLDRHVIVRTSWVFGVTGHNFVRTIMRAAAERDELRVVDDQFGSPTPAADIARACRTIADALAGGGRGYGTFHFAGSPPTSWHGFAEHIVAGMRRRGAVRAQRVRPIGSDEWPTATPRPAYTVLDCQKISDVYGIALPDWRAGLHRVMGELQV